MSGLSPSDAAVAIRSFPRRFRSLLASPEHDEDDPRSEEVDPDELARRPGPDGSSAADRLAAADAVLAAIDGALARAVGHGAGAREPADDPAGVSVRAPERPLADLLEQLAATAARCAERIERVPTDEWGRQLEVRGRDEAVGLLDVVRAGVDAAAAHLRAAERILRAVS